MKTKSLPPYAPTLMESTRAIGYTLEAAIADVIDNSVSASASFVDIFFFPMDDSYVAILDDGIGMNASALETAMRYGSQNPNEKRATNDMGRFGLGLKTASLSQCRTLTVASGKDGQIEVRQWDLDHVIATDDWSLIELDSQDEIDIIPHIDKLRELKSGTLVVWQNLDRLKVGELDFGKSMGKMMDEVRTHLSLVFHRYINGEPGLAKVQIRMNNTPICATDPFLTKRNTQVMSDEYIYIDNSTVVIRPYILPHISDMSREEVEVLGGKDGLRKKQGFYVYRNKRLLVWGTWFRMMRQGELSKLARVQVDIPNALDNLWTLDIKKSTAIPPEAVRQSLASIIERLSGKSKHTWEYRGKLEMRDSIVHIWQRFKGKQGGYFYGINRDHPLIEIFSEATPQFKKNLEVLLKAIETGIPLNQLYVDLTSDKPTENEAGVTEAEVAIIIEGMLGQMPTPQERKVLLERLCQSAPFVYYPKLIERYEGENLNGNN